MTDYQTAIAAYAQRTNPPGFILNTPQAIKKFQSFHGLTPDGIIGPKTRAVMRRLNTSLGPSTPPPTMPHLIGHHPPNPFGAFGPRIENA